MDINGSSAIVTGAASGIGAAVARQLAAKGAIVVVADLQADKGEALAAEIGGVFAKVDVTDTEQITAAVNAAAEIAPLRAVVNSAGIGWAQRTIGRDGQIESAHDLAAFTKVIQINLIGTFDMVRQAASVMSRNEPDADGQRGAIVNMASVAAFDGQIGQAAYSTSKGGIVGMTLPVARDLSASGIRLNTVAPGLIDTPIYGEGPDAEAFKAKLGESVLFPKRLGVPDELASMVVECLTQLLHERRDDPRRRRHPDAPQVTRRPPSRRTPTCQGTPTEFPRPAPASAEHRPDGLVQLLGVGDLVARRTAVERPAARSGETSSASTHGSGGSGSSSPSPMAWTSSANPPASRLPPRPRAGPEPANVGCAGHRAWRACSARRGSCPGVVAAEVPVRRELGAVEELVEGADPRERRVDLAVGQQVRRHVLGQRRLAVPEQAEPPWSRVGAVHQPEVDRARGVVAARPRVPVGPQRVQVDDDPGGALELGQVDGPRDRLGQVAGTGVGVHADELPVVRRAQQLHQPGVLPVPPVGDVQVEVARVVDPEELLEQVAQAGPRQPDPLRGASAGT